MWACLMRLFRVVVLKRSHLRHWLKTTSWKDVSSAALYLTCTHAYANAKHAYAVRAAAVERVSFRGFLEAFALNCP